MSTLIRPEISKRKAEWIPKYRYYELKYFCLQYPEWKKYSEYMNYISSRSIVNAGNTQIEFVDRVPESVFDISDCNENVRLVEEICKAVGTDLWQYLLEAVTKGETWNYLKYVQDIPCGRSAFYKMYRKFFYELDKIKR